MSGPELELENQSTVVAGLYGMSDRVGNTAVPKGECLQLTTSEGLEVLVFAARRMRWTHAGAMRLLQGMNPKDILGPQWLVINGSPTPPGSPSPGIAMPILAKVLKNPLGIPPEEVFKVIWQVTGLSA